MYSPFRTGDSTVDRNLDAIKSELDNLSSPTSSVAARYTGSLTGTPPTAIGTTITYATKTYDTTSSYSRGVYTVPQTGLYDIRASMAVNSATVQGSFIVIVINGSPKSYMYVVRPVAINYNLMSAVSDVLSLSQGDRVEIQYYVDVATGTLYTGGPAFQYFTIRLV